MLTAASRCHSKVVFAPRRESRQIDVADSPRGRPPSRLVPRRNYGDRHIHHRPSRTGNACRAQEDHRVLEGPRRRRGRGSFRRRDVRGRCDDAKQDELQDDH